jgi:hypothetical protein
MACYVRSLTMKEFRGMDLMSGSLRVHGRSRPRRGARPPKGTAIERKQLEPAATDVESGEAVGGDATSSVATARKRKANAGAAEQTPEAERATEKKGSGEPPSLWDRRMELGKGPAIPENGRAFLKALNEQIDFVSMYVLLLRSPDDKLAGRLAEQALKMAFSENGEGEEDWRASISEHLPWAKRD